MTPHTIEHPSIRFQGTSGYTRHPDTLTLFAEQIDNLNTDGSDSGELALQLWACQAPYTGGELTGWALATLPLGVLHPGEHLTSVRSEVPARFPESGDFAIALVIAEWDGEGFNRIHDVHNYPQRDLFVHPRLEGTVGYRCIDDTHLVVDIERISNPRDTNNTSGTLALELWALNEPYSGGDFQGQSLGAQVLGTLAGGASWSPCTCEMAFDAPAPGLYTLVLMLREWTGNGYATRDHCNFATQVTFPLPLSPPGDETSAQANDAPEQATMARNEDAAQDNRPRASQGARTPENAEREADPPTPSDTGTRQPSEPDASPHTLRDDWKGYARRLWEWVKRHW